MEDDRDDVSRPWARIFDLIEAEYGAYDDEKVLDLTLDRVLQMVDVISERRKEHLEVMRMIRLQELELAVKHLAMAGAVASQSKKQNKWLEGFVRKMDFVKLMGVKPSGQEEEEDNLPSMSQVMAAFGAGADGQMGKRVT